MKKKLYKNKKKKRKPRKSKIWKINSVKSKFLKIKIESKKIRIHTPVKITILQENLKRVTPYMLFKSISSKRKILVEKEWENKSMKFPTKYLINTIWNILSNKF
jgi:hypothetical protein